MTVAKGNNIDKTWKQREIVLIIVAKATKCFLTVTMVTVGKDKVFCLLSGATVGKNYPLVSKDNKHEN